MAKKSIFQAVRGLMTRQGRNLSVNEVDVYVSGNRIVAQGVCHNDCGGRYSNEDTETIPAVRIPNWLWRKFYDMKGKYFSIDESDNITVYGNAGVA